MNPDTCGCCEGIEVITPIAIANRPELSALAYRTGTHATFLETMLARLSDLGIKLKELGIPLGEHDDPGSLIYPLSGLTTRSTDDPSIAFLDAWAIVTDILTFYQERIANEGYLPTATERRSILELARLVGYTLRPGVASSVFLAYTLEDGHDTIIPKGSRAQSLPGPGQLPQSFETSVDLEARSQWNNLQPRMSVPQHITQVRLPFRITFIDTDTPDGSLYLAGTGTNLKPHDPVFFVFGDETRPYTSRWTGEQVFSHVQKVDPHPAEKYTKVTFPATFTPLVFLRSALELIEQYLDFAAFGISPDDPGISDISIPLILLKDMLQLIESFAALVVADPSLLDPQGSGTATIMDFLIALVLMVAMLMLVESYEDLELTLVSPSDQNLTINDVLESLKQLSAILQTVEGYLELIQSGLSATDQQVTDVIAQLQSQQQALSAFAKGVANQQLGGLLNGVAVGIANFLSAISKAPPTDPERESVIADMQDTLQAIQGFLFKASSTPVSRQNATAVVTLLDLWDALTRFLGLSIVGASGKPSGGQSFVKDHRLPVDQLTIGIFSAWCRDYSNAVQGGATKLANWIGGLINDTKSLISTLPGGGVIVKNVCTPTVTTNLARLVAPLAKPPSQPPPDSARLRRDPKQIFGRKGDIAAQLLVTLRPEIGSILYDALSNADVTPQPSLRNFYALRVKAVPFGSNAPTQSQTVQGTDNSTPPNTTFTTGKGPDWDFVNPPSPNVLDLDARYDQIVPNSWVVIEYATTLNNLFPSIYQLVFRVTDVQTVSRADYGMSAKVTRLILDREWPRGNTGTLADIRIITVYAQSEELALAEEPLTDDISGDKVELDGLYDGLQSGRWAIVSGERTDVPHTSGIRTSELVMLASVTQDVRRLSTPPSPAVPMARQSSRPTQPPGTLPGEPATKVQAPSFPTSTAESSPKTEGAQAEAPPPAQPEQQASQGISIPAAESVKVEAPAKRGKKTPRATTTSEATAPSEAAPTGAATVEPQSAGPSVNEEAQNQERSASAANSASSAEATQPGGESATAVGEDTQPSRDNRPPPVSTTAAALQRGDPPPPGTVPPATLPGDKTHTFLHFAQPLAYTYKRDTVRFAGNVVPATHGETQNEVLGSGDGNQSMQRFTLRKSPLTYLSAPTPAGADSTLEVRVNDILWHEKDNLNATGPKDRTYVTRTDDQDKTTIIFGNGQHGARLPTGAENVKAVYRVGIGKPGNVDAGQISLLATRPLGVKSVNNPLPATGGANRESPDQARRNVPLATMSLDRIVSVQDYADFARTFAGIGKASALSLSSGRRQLVHLTIAGLDNIPIAKSSDLYRHLFAALRQFGNPSTPLRVDLAEVKLLVISARVLVLPDYTLESVAPNIRTALNNAFGFEQRELGQTAYQSEVLSVIQGVAGVAYVDLDIMDAVDQQKLLDALNQIHADEMKEANSGQKPDPTADLIKLLKLKLHKFVRAQLARPDPRIDGEIDPAQLVFLSSDVPDTLIITELTNERKR